MSNTWTTRDWIIRGLVMSCITEHTLYRWYREHATNPVNDVQFWGELKEAIAHDLVYMQRSVPCYEHRTYIMHAPMEKGWALTEKGEKLDPAMRGVDDA